MPADTWTVLTSRGPRMAKLVTPDGVQGYESAKHFATREVEVPHLRAWRAVLAKLIDRPTSCLVWGRRRDPDTTERRAELFEDPGHHLLPIDIDLAGRELTPEEAVRDLLPLSFQDVSFCYQWTASQGLKAGTRLRLFFWCDRRVTCAEAAHWLRGAPVDAAIYRLVQPLYTARPVFEGVDDPVPERVGWVEGVDEEVCVPHIEAPPAPSHEPIEPLTAFTDVARRGLLHDLNMLDAAAGRDAQIGGWIVAAVAHGMPEPEIIAHATSWLEAVDPGRSRVQPREVPDWIRSAHNGLRSGKFQVDQWYLDPAQDFADATSSAAAEAEVLRGFAPVSFRALRKRGIRRMEWLVEGILPAKGCGMIFSPSNVGKTYVTLSMIASLSQGTNWLGNTVNKRGLCFYLPGEGAQEIVNRLEAWRVVHGAEVDDLDRIVLHDPASIDRPLDLSDPKTIGAACRKILDTAGDSPVNCVVLDTLASMAGSLDENDNSAMSQAWAHLHKLSRKLDCLVLVVHHTGWQSAQRERGASAIRGTLDVNIGIEGEPGANRVRIVCTKMRDGAWFKPIPCAFKQVTLTADDGLPLPQQALVRDEDADSWSRSDEALAAVLKDVHETASGAAGARYVRLQGRGFTRAEVDAAWAAAREAGFIDKIQGQRGHWYVIEEAQSALWSDKAPLAIRLLAERRADFAEETEAS